MVCCRVELVSAAAGTLLVYFKASLVLATLQRPGRRSQSGGGAVPPLFLLNLCGCLSCADAAVCRYVCLQFEQIRKVANQELELAWAELAHEAAQAKKAKKMPKDVA